MVWELDWSHLTKSHGKKVGKNHPNEYMACIANLETVRKYLEIGLKLGAGLKFGFFCSEGSGLYRVGQSGVPSPKEMRIYICFDEVSEIIYVVGVGFKEGQKTDIKEAKKLVRKLRRTK